MTAPTFTATRRNPFSSETKIGAQTNFGKFLGFDEKGFALFETVHGKRGWTGPQAFNLIQIISEK